MDNRQLDIQGNYSILFSLVWMHYSFNICGGSKLLYVIKSILFYFEMPYPSKTLQNISYPLIVLGQVFIPFQILRRVVND